MEQYSAVPPEFMAYLMGVKPIDEPRIDPWQEIEKLALVDPYCRTAVDLVRYGRMTKEEATSWLAVDQTRRAMKLQEKAIDLLKVMPLPPILVPAGQWTGPMAHEGPTGEPE
ncbi:MAG TPA: hypothetical protein VF783_13775 [Terriglobales bacterium]